MLILISLSTKFPVQLHRSEHPGFDLTGIVMLGAQDIPYELLLQHWLHQAKTKKQGKKERTVA